MKLKQLIALAVIIMFSLVSSIISRKFKKNKNSNYNKQQTTQMCKKVCTFVIKTLSIDIGHNKIEFNKHVNGKELECFYMDGSVKNVFYPFNRKAEKYIPFNDKIPIYKFDEIHMGVSFCKSEPYVA